MDATSSNLGIPSSKEFVRIHGLQFPLNFYQILSWIIFLFEFFATILLFIASLPLALKVSNFSTFPHPLRLLVAFLY